jgi:hypothetical protein
VERATAKTEAHNTDIDHSNRPRSQEFFHTSTREAALRGWSCSCKMP